MNNFAEKIRSLVFFRKSNVRLPDLTPFDFVKTKKGILKELIISKQSGNLVGVYSMALGEGMFLTVVEEIDSTGKEEVIVFNQYDISGHILLRTKVAIDEIRMVCPFNKGYRNPVLTAKIDKNGRLHKITSMLA